MNQSLTHRALVCLCDKEPSYQNLVDLYNALRTGPSEKTSENVAQHALAQVVGEIIDYLDLVGAEFEKSIGLTRQEERERILSSFSQPNSEDPVEQIDDLISQWRAINRYSQDNLVKTKASSNSQDDIVTE